eukprot:Gb_38441 [translate_table: standard]
MAYLRTIRRLNIPIFITLEFPLPISFSLPPVSLFSSSIVTLSTTLNPNCKSQPKNYANNLYRNSQWKEAVGIYQVETQQGIPLDPDTYASFLQACANTRALSEGKQVHAHVLIAGFDQDVFLGTKLVNLYAICGRLGNARQIFDNIRKRNIFLWNAMIRGYATNGVSGEALSLYYQMQRAGVYPDNFTFPFVLKACANLSALEEGKEIHYHLRRNGLESDVFVGTALIDMYTKCGSIENARHVFDEMSQRNVVLWTAMIAGYVQNGHANEALALFYQMQLVDVIPDSVTMASVLPACALLAALQQGKQIHNCIIRSGFHPDVSVGTALVDMYAKCGSIENAWHVFDKICRRDIVSWNAMIAGYAQNGHASEALSLFHQMQLEGVTPNSVTTVSVLPACAHLAALQRGMWIHAYIIRSGFELDLSVGNSLVDMYAKCGCIQAARQLFDEMSQKDVVSWSVMIGGYGMHGYGEDALTIFAQMQQTGIKPDHVTFIGVLSACSHAGLVEEGQRYFYCMSHDYCITPRIEHYACMVDLLGRAGHLDEALDFIKRMPLEPDVNAWGALFGACRIHCNIELGEYVLERILELNPNNAGSYILLSNLYAAAGRWDGVVKARTMIKDRGLKKSPGSSWIEIKNSVHAFLGGNRSHPQSDRIFSLLESLAGQMKQAGYIPDTSFVLRDLEEEEKEYILCNHSEKLAIAFGLMNTRPGTPIRVTKNLRMDCALVGITGDANQNENQIKLGADKKTLAISDLRREADQGDSRPAITITGFFNLMNKLMSCLLLAYSKDHVIIWEAAFQEIGI